MGVTGLWRLIEPAGKPVPVETLENKVLAVDISIWLHQMVKGYQDAKGAPLPNAHLMGLFQRLCKLLYFRIKPIFVFDGGFPELKRETIAKRQDHKSKYQSESERLKRELALLLGKKTVLGNLMGKQISPKKSADVDNDDLFKLPALPQREEEESESDSEDEQNSSGSIIDVHSIDVNSENFKNLPVKEKYDLLMELKETRKMNSWGKLHELPKKSDNFSDFQMQRLLKRRKVQECIEETEKEMGSSGMSLNDLESLLNEEGIDTKMECLPSRIASNNTTRFLLINNVKQALAEAKQKELKTQESLNKVEAEPEKTKETKDELDDDLKKAIQMSLECEDDETVVKADCSKTDDSWTSFMTGSDYSNSDSEEFDQPDMSCAKAYIKQYCDFTPQIIDRIVAPKKNKKKQTKRAKNIENEINKGAMISETVDLSSSDEEMLEKEVESEMSDNKTKKVNCFEKTNLDATQSSIIFVENPAQSILELLSDSNDDVISLEKQKDDETSLAKSETETSDDDFEEVNEIETIKSKPIVQVTLNNLNKSIEDDIFADVFAPKTEQQKEDKSRQVNLNPEKLCIDKPSDSKSDNTLKVDSAVLNSESKVEAIRIKKSENIKEIITEKISLNTETDTATSKENRNERKNSEPPNDKVPENQNTRTEIFIEPKTLSKENLSAMAQEIEGQEQVLIQEKGKLDRIGRNITEEMTKEAQELLQLFGIPYVVAPMEAEAQCAFLESINLTDGTITDDSDIWLFGGRTVYKNFFNQKKHVLQFLADRIEKSYNLTREQLILLALLVGSDYTAGVTGVGPVTAMEILASFPFKKQFYKEAEQSQHSNYAHVVTGLQQFKQWVRTGKRTDNTSLKKKLKNVVVTDDFPSVRVVQAYLEPNVEKSDEKFTWGEIDITILRDYTKSKFGWSQNKLDEIINPVLKRILERKSQKTVHDFFKRKVQFQSLDEQMSKRVKAAVHKMGPDAPGEDVEAEKVEKIKKVRKRKNQVGDVSKAGLSETKQAKTDDNEVHKDHRVRVATVEGKSEIEIHIPKTDRFQEMIPQREKEKQSLLSNKLKAIEVFRKTNIDKKRKISKRKALLPKEKAELSESSDTE